jgi:hypothetical protein
LSKSLQNPALSLPERQFTIEIVVELVSVVGISAIVAHIAFKF